MHLEDPAGAREELWKASVRRFNLMCSEERKAEGREYHAAQARRLKVLMGALIDHHEQQAESLMSKDKEGSDKSDE